MQKKRAKHNNSISTSAIVYGGVFSHFFFWKKEKCRKHGTNAIYWKNYEVPKLQRIQNFNHEKCKKPKKKRKNKIRIYNNGKKKDWSEMFGNIYVNERNWIMKRICNEDFVTANKFRNLSFFPRDVNGVMLYRHFGGLYYRKSINKLNLL